MQSINITAYTEDAEKIEALKHAMQVLNIHFEINSDKVYNPDFVKKILQGDQDFKEGKGRKISLEELNSLWK